MKGARFTSNSGVDSRKIMCTLTTKDKPNAHIFQLCRDWVIGTQELEALFAVERTVACTSQDMKSKKIRNFDLSYDNLPVRFAIQLSGTPTHVTDRFVDGIERLARELVSRQLKADPGKQEISLDQKENDLKQPKDKQEQREKALEQQKTDLEHWEGDLQQRERGLDERERVSDRPRREVNLNFIYGERWHRTSLAGSDSLYAVAAEIHDVKRTAFILRKLARSIPHSMIVTADSVGAVDGDEFEIVARR